MKGGGKPFLKVNKSENKLLGFAVKLKKGEMQSRINQSMAMKTIAINSVEGDGSFQVAKLKWKALQSLRQFEWTQWIGWGGER